MILNGPNPTDSALWQAREAKSLKDIGHPIRIAVGLPRPDPRYRHPRMQGEEGIEPPARILHPAQLRMAGNEHPERGVDLGVDDVGTVGPTDSLRELAKHHIRMR